MSWGIQQWGLGPWGSGGFVITDHVPVDNATGVVRLTPISFTISSQGSDIDISTLNLTANGIDLILAGVFTSSATGTIDDTDLTNVLVSLIVTSAFPPNTLVSINVSVQNDVGQAPTSGTTWSFTTNNQLALFTNYIVRRFERVNRVGAAGIDAPLNPNAIVEIPPPPDLEAEVI